MFFLRNISFNPEAIIKTTNGRATKKNLMCHRLKSKEKITGKKAKRETIRKFWSLAFIFFIKNIVNKNITRIKGNNPKPRPRNRLVRGEIKEERLLSRLKNQALFRLPLFRNKE